MFSMKSPSWVNICFLAVKISQLLVGGKGTGHQWPWDSLKPFWVARIGGIPELHLPSSLPSVPYRVTIT